MIYIFIFIIILFVINIIFYFIPKKKGDRGLNGYKGDNGLVGDMGEYGDIGNVGYKGNIGDLSANFGLNGEKGDKGDNGSKGDKGIIGLNGLPGEPGDKGEKGEIGNKGAKGKIGLPGPEGKLDIDLNITPNLKKCVLIDKENKSFKCPKDMVLVDMKVKKIDNSLNSLIENVICCNIGYNNNYNYIPELKKNLDKIKIIIKNPNQNGNDINFKESITKYNIDDLTKMLENINLINSIILDKVDINEIPFLNEVNDDLKKNVVLYSDDLINKWINISGSISNYLKYLLNLLAKFYLKTGNLTKLLDQLLLFPENDISYLEKKIKLY